MIRTRVSWPVARILRSLTPNGLRVVSVTRETSRSVYLEGSAVALYDLASVLRTIACDPRRPYSKRHACDVAAAAVQRSITGQAKHLGGEGSA